MTQDIKQGFLYLFIAAALVALYLLAAGMTGESGFPLDDAWIHQTYARNLAKTGRWEYVPGEVSAGSTAPLWTLMLAVGYLFHLPYKAWTWGLGVLLLAASGLNAYRIAARLFPRPGWVAQAVGLLCLAEWHLVWAAASGMETVLFVALSLALVERLGNQRSGFGIRDSGIGDREAGIGNRESGNGKGESEMPSSGRQMVAGGGGMAGDGPRFWVGVGAIAGLLVLTRPEGILLLGVIALLWGWWAVWGGWTWQGAWKAALWAAVPFLLLIAPYLWFNLGQSGRLWPNTFYAKQIEYAALLAEPFPARLARVALPPLSGFQILLLPGFLAAGWCLLAGRFRAGSDRSQITNRKSQTGNRKSQITNHKSQLSRSCLIQIVLFVYPILLLVLYACRLPVSYQHGRYLIPMIPPLILLGVGGTARWLRFRHPAFWIRALSQSWSGSLVVLALIYLVLGARAFSQDVQVIQTEMVSVARWLSVHSQADEMVAAHDIGAIGYWSGRAILDLAGLVSPEVATLLGDEHALAEYVLDGPARYLVTAPGWAYSSLTRRSDVILLYETNSPWTEAAGLNSSAVYRLPD